MFQNNPHDVEQSLDHEAGMYDITRSVNDIGRFEQYRNGMYPTRPDKIN